MSMECEKKKAPIGVFDSGVGGLTVVREITRQLPHENIVYFGDTARVPYGSKSKSNIIRFSEQIIRFLKTKQVKAIEERYLYKGDPSDGPEHSCEGEGLSAVCPSCGRRI